MLCLLSLSDTVVYMSHNLHLSSVMISNHFYFNQNSQSLCFEIAKDHFKLRLLIHAHKNLFLKWWLINLKGLDHFLRNLFYIIYTINIIKHPYLRCLINFVILLWRCTISWNAESRVTCIMPQKVKLTRFSIQNKAKIKQYTVKISLIWHDKMLSL